MAREKFLSGLNLDKILGDVGAELGRLGVQGQAELGAALFQGNAYVPYGQGQNRLDAGPEQEAPMSLEGMRAEVKEAAKEREHEPEREKAKEREWER